jgi:hypothetical protein
LLTGIGVYDTDDKALEAVVSGQKVRFKVNVLFLDDIEEPTVGILIRDRLGVDMFGTNTKILGQNIGPCRFGDRISVCFDLDLNLGPGTYTLTSAVHAGDTHIEACYDWADKLLAFRVIPSGDFHFQGSVKLFAGADVNRHQRDESVDLASALDKAIGEVPSELDLGPSSGTLLGGWFGPELEGREYGRWTGPEASFLLGRKGNAIHLKIKTNHPEVADKPLSVGMEINGVMLEEIKLKDEDWHEVSFTLPESVQGHVLLGRLKVSDSWRPSEIGDSDDSRELSLKIAALSSVDMPSGS